MTAERDKWPDAVKRVKDEMDYHATMGHYGFVAIAIADGVPLDHTAYPTWAEAVKAAKWDRDNYMFPEIQPDGMPTYREANAVLEYARTIHGMGHRIPDPTDPRMANIGELASSMPRTAHDRRRMASQLAIGSPLVPSDVPYGNLHNIPGKGNVPPAFLRKG